MYNTLCKAVFIYMPKQEKTCPYLSLLVLFSYGTNPEHRFDFFFFFFFLSWVVYENKSKKHVRRIKRFDFSKTNCN